jgi:diaminopimelate epimerase
LRYAEHIYSAQLAPANFVPNIKFIAKTDVFNKNDNGIYSFVYEGKRIFYVEVMEPNLILNEKMSNHELFSLGRKLNQHADLFPIGININACVILPDNVLQVMTYERGVQRLTLSCGTGATAAVALYLNRTQGNVNVITLGGLLEIRVDKINIELKGPATLE